MIIDVWTQTITPRMAAAPWLESLRRWTGKAYDEASGSVEGILASMEGNGIDISLLSAWSAPEGDLISNAQLRRAIEQSPTKLRGLATANLSRPMDAVRELKEIVDGEQIVGVRIQPWVWDLPPNDRRYYPIYTACVELGVPFCTQIGHTGPLRRSETGRLIPYLEDVLLDFPELTIVGGHVGFPWLDEVTSLTVKFPNFFVDTSAYVLKRLPPDFVRYMKNVGRGRVMFGSNWPMLDQDACLEGLSSLDLRDVDEAAFLGGTAQKVFGL